MLRNVFRLGAPLALFASGPAAGQDHWLLDRRSAQRAASDVVLATVIHVTVPRGSIGRCHVEANVDRAERGGRYRYASTVQGPVPCVASLSDRRARGRRWVLMRELRRGAARIYVAADGAISDVVPLVGLHRAR